MHIGIYAGDAPPTIAATRLECCRQGTLEAEARVYIERALSDHACRGKISEDLSKRAQDILDERTRAMLAFEAAPEW